VLLLKTLETMLLLRRCYSTYQVKPLLLKFRVLLKTLLLLKTLENMIAAAIQDAATAQATAVFSRRWCCCVSLKGGGGVLGS
jgi:hypothetical protein